MLGDKRLRADLNKVIRGVDKRYTNEAADKLGGFDRPALIAWSREDKFFKPEHAERLARDLPNARARVDRRRAHVLDGGQPGAV